MSVMKSLECFGLCMVYVALQTLAKARRMDSCVHSKEEEIQVLNNCEKTQAYADLRCRVQL